ncbi:unnamed protein product [Rotaria sordida]|uniref:Uncharacterized protein n=1 Tax=Rotaria sordida TaxID=392033 RepID=A0A816EFJ2_9BILA|nr:unnamed protein product [Rotaria sordida]CAF1648453.1 unnamed protein product [Rotaria sordida]
MLSQEEYEDIKYKLKSIPSSITGKHRQNLCRIFKKQLKEHEYTSTYPPFIPLSHKLFFINYATTEQTLIHLIETINISNIFTLDTESICIYKQPNQPTLIQLQIIRQKLNSYVIIIEVYHLPQSTTIT